MITRLHYWLNMYTPLYESLVELKWIRIVNCHSLSTIFYNFVCFVVVSCCFLPPALSFIVSFCSVFFFIINQMICKFYTGKRDNVEFINNVTSLSVRLMSELILRVCLHSFYQANCLLSGICLSNQMDFIKGMHRKKWLTSKLWAN